MRKTAEFFQDDVYTCICDLTTNNHTFSADIYYHDNCFQIYIRTFELSKRHKVIQKKKLKKGICYFCEYVDLIRNISSHGNGISLSEIREIIQNGSSFKISNKKAK